MAAVYGHLWVALLLCLIGQPAAFELEEQDWEYLRSDVASLHRLKGLAHRFKHHPIRVQHDHKIRAPRESDGHCERLQLHNEQNRWNQHSELTNQTSLKWNSMAKAIFADFKHCPDIAECILQKQQELNMFLERIEKEKTHDALLIASEVSYSYSNKVILIMDNEPETLKKAEEEYSEDPYYSTKANMTCLDSDSCSSIVNIGTVLKIIGSNAEDGNTLSGYSGTQLASLMLKLQKASLFSITGNVSSTFRNNFIRVFAHYHINAVLETTIQNDHVYQIMDATGASVEYQVPKRPVDHSTQYDHQQILIMQDDHVVRDAATFLYEKHPTVSSVYILENQRPKLIKGDPVPLSAESRLTLVGHGKTGADEKMQVGGYEAEKVAEIIEHMNIDGNQIKTTSMVACEVGLDEVFRKTLLKDLHARSIETELHSRSSLLQVTKSGQKITGEITPDGIVWKHKDDSKKVIDKLDRNGEFVTQTLPGNSGEVTYSNERSILGGQEEKKTWPEQPERFVSLSSRQPHTDDLEGLAWAFFHDRASGVKQAVELMHPGFDQNKQYTIYDLDLTDIKPNYGESDRINSEEAIKEILNNCYEIKSGEDILNLITYYAAAEVKDATYLMLNDWIYKVHPLSLYVFPVGKRLNTNQDANDIKTIIKQQHNKHAYPDIREGINNCEGVEHYAKYARESLQGVYAKDLEPVQESWLSTMFLASVISESSRNFRSFPITLMAIDMTLSQNSKTEVMGLRYLLENHPMTKGGTWINTKYRGFYGSSTELKINKNDAKEKRLKNKKNENLLKLTEKENTIVSEWLETNGIEEINTDMLLKLVYDKDKLNKEFSETENSFENLKLKFKDSYEKFIKEIKSSALTSGTLGGSHDGAPTLRDVHSVADVESPLKLSSHYSRSSAMLAEHIHSELQRTFGEKVQELHVKSDSIKIQEGEFHCELVFDMNPHEIKKWKTQLTEESKSQMERFDKMVSEMTTPHITSGHLERGTKTLGVIGLILGAQGAVRAYEQGDIEHGTVATLQTIHGVTGMTMAALGKRVSLAAEGKVKAISTFFKNPVTKRALAVFPIVGIGFGIYNIKEDFKRGDMLGYVDATLDTLIVGLDVLEFVPELDPIIIPVNLVLNAIRMAIDDIYLDTQAELNTLPPDATVLAKIGAFFRGLNIGSVHFMYDVGSFFYTIPYREIENGQKLVEQISDYHKYYRTEVQAGRKAIDFTGGESSWNGGSITFCLSDTRSSEMCMDYFVSADERGRKMCWSIDTDETDDIVLGTGESNELTYSNIPKKVLLFIPAGSVKVVSGYEALTNSRYGKYSGNNKDNKFYAVQTNKDSHQMEVMLDYYYELHGKAGSDTFYLGPQKSYVEGQSGKDMYIIPKDGGKTDINNYDPLKAMDLLILSINYDQISATKSNNDVLLQFCNNHSVTIKEWFTGETYRHINIMSADGVLFDISTTVISSVKLVARGVNMMSQSEGQIVDTTEPLLINVANIMGSTHNDWLIGNTQKNMIDGGGGQDYMKGGEGEDVYVVNEKKNYTVQIENYARDKKMDMLIIEANLHAFKTKVERNNLILVPFRDDRSVTLLNWFCSEEDRHLLVVTKDLITFSLSADKALCSQPDPFHSKCILSQSIDYRESTRPLVIDLETEETFLNVTYLHGSNLPDNIKGNAQANTIIPGSGRDFLQGRGGQDLYIVTPGYGLKTIDNFSPDLALDTLFLKGNYELIAVKCFGPDLKLLVNETEEVHLKAWFRSKMSQHLQVRTADGIIFRLQTNLSKCVDHTKLPWSVDYRNRASGQVMLLDTREFVFVEEMYGSPGFDCMRGNDKDNLLDPFTGGGIMMGREGKDTYVVKPEYGPLIEIYNFATDEKEDTVLFQADFLSTPFTVVGENINVIISANNKGQNMMVRLYLYRVGRKYQHLSFQSADGVHFRVKSPITNQSEILQDPWIEAFKVILKDKQLDCYIDLSSQKNLSTVYTVQGCSYQSNHIQGNDQDNALFGGMKDDVLDGGDGHDILIGGQGNDILLGSTGNDMLYGDDGDDTMLGGSGWDSFIPGPGADVMDGGPGRDTVFYQGDHVQGEGVYISLLSGEGHQADAEGDVLKDVENVIGTIYPDILVSGYEPALLKGSDGDDVLVSVAEGDYLIGGEGRDIYMVVPHNGWITIDNCAEDNAMDFLYLPSVSEGSAECNVSSSGIHLKFPLANDAFMGIFLKDFVNHNHKCGHLTLIMPGGILSRMVQMTFIDKRLAPPFYGFLSKRYNIDSYIQCDHFSYLVSYLRTNARLRE